VECRDWIKAHGAQRRNIAGGERDSGEYKSDASEGGQISRRHAEEQSGHEVRNDQRTGHTQPGASGGQTESPAQDLPNAVSLFGRSLELDYYGKHLIGYINDDHLPGYLGITTVHLGQQNKDPDLIAKGDQMLDFSAYQFPEFNNFNRWAAHNTDFKDSDSYKKALDSLWEALDACIGTTLDRSNPDLKQYLHLQTPTGRKKACWSEGALAPHSFEGFMLNLGNGLVKAGKVESAKVMYENAKYADNYSTWPYRRYLEEVVNSDLYARAALYADSSSSNDPPMGIPNRGCSYCHATVREPDTHSFSEQR